MDEVRILPKTRNDSPRIVLVVDEVRTPVLLKRLLNHITISKSECWEWTLSTNKQGYGHLTYNGNLVKASRLMMHLTCNFSLESKLFVLHHCDNPLCINPKHLFIGTNRDNYEDCKRKGRVSSGEAHSCSKLSDSQIESIRLDYQNGMSSYALARKYKINNAYAWRLATGRRRK